MSEKWRQSEICIGINDKSQGSVANHLSCDDFLHCKFITQFAVERIFKIGERLAKLQAKWLIVSYAPFALHFYPQRYRTRQISETVCVLWTDTVANTIRYDTRCYVNVRSKADISQLNLPHGTDK